MGTCLMCHRKIRNGQKFCDSCKLKRKNRADESYLDSLLTSVGVKSTVSDKYNAIDDSFYDEVSENDQVSDGYVQVPDNYGQIPESAEQTPEVYQQEQNDSWQTAEDYGQEIGGNEPVGDSYGEVDDLVSGILDDMDQAVPDAADLESEPEIGEEDLDNIFDDAEAYASLIGNQESGNGGFSDDFSQASDDGSQKENDVDALFDEIDNSIIDTGFESVDFSEMTDLGNEGEVSGEDEILNNIDKTLQGENTEQISVSQAFPEFDPIQEEISKPKKKKKKKLGFFQRLFGNTNDEVTPEMIEADRIKKEEQEKEAQAKKEEKKKKDEQKKAQAEADKARKKAEADAERNRKMALAAEKKAAAKEKERKKKETALAIAEYEMEHGKINKAGAAILFVIFAILTVVIIIGTNIYSYNLSIKNAQEDFDVQKYNEAYYEVYGLKIQGEDIELYDKIMTVMFVNHQLNSYEYYMTSKNREKALDSLLKGLQRYDKYYQLAQRLNITDDLNYVKGEILEKLQSEFNLTEDQAYTMVSMEETVDYTEYLYGLLGTYPEELEKYN